MRLTKNNLAKMEAKFYGISQEDMESMVHKWMANEDYNRLHVAYWALDDFVCAISLRQEVYEFLRDNHMAPEGRTNAEYRGL